MLFADAYSRIEAQASELGNYHRKYLFFVSKTKNKLLQRLETEGVYDQVHLRTPAADLATEMDVIRSVSTDEKENLNFLGCYFAIQLLHMKLRTLSVMTMELTAGKPRIDAYRSFLLSVGDRFEQLTSIYMEKLLDIFIAPELRPEFVVFNCGTKADQDDIDIGVVDDGSDQRKDLNRAIARLIREMIRRASPLHLYLSEHVGSMSYTASIDEYEELLETGIHDFIIINEMIGATPSFGSPSLFGEFQQRVTRRYYFDPDGDNRFHEGFLRGILGEIRSLVIGGVKHDRINPKNDGVRLLKGCISVGKTIFQVDSANPWKILEALKMQDPDRKDTYNQIDEALSYLETVRHLYQLYAAQEEEICFDVAGTRENLQRVGKAMGYRDMGFITASDHLLIHYAEYIDRAKEAAEVFLKDVTRQLKAMSSFTPMLSRSRLSVAPENGKGGNLAIELIEAMEFFKGTRFWDDALGALDAKDGVVLGHWRNALQNLDPEERAETIRRYIDWGIYSPFTLTSFLLILAKDKRKADNAEIFEAINGAFLAKLAQSADPAGSMARIFSHYPELVNRYLMALREGEIELFEALLDEAVWDEELNEVRQQLQHLCDLHHRYSRYFRRFFRRVVTKYPQYVPVLHDPAKLRQIAQGNMGNLDSLDTLKARMENMGEYFDLEFFRLGQQTLQGYPLPAIDREFIDFSDTYLTNLFDVCKEEVNEVVGLSVRTRDLLGLFTTGGHARHQAFDDDYDLIVLLDSDDAEILDYSVQVLTRVNREITKRGIMPHFRFADYFGSFVTRFSQLHGFLTEPREDRFIDQCQLLEARMVVGSQHLQKEFERRIVEPYIFERVEQYIHDMVRELRSRHEDTTTGSDEQLNFKECTGGLRDIEMLLLIYKARYRLLTPIGKELFYTLERMLPDYAREFQVLRRALDFTKQARYLYRLSASADDSFVVESLDTTATAMEFLDDDGNGDVWGMKSAFKMVTWEAYEVIQKLIDNDDLLDPVG